MDTDYEEGERAGMGVGGKTEMGTFGHLDLIRDLEELEQAIRSEEPSPFNIKNPKLAPQSTNGLVVGARDKLKLSQKIDVAGSESDSEESASNSDLESRQKSPPKVRPKSPPKKDESSMPALPPPPLAEPSVGQLESEGWIEVIHKPRPNRDTTPAPRIHDPADQDSATRDVLRAGEKHYWEWTVEEVADWIDSKNLDPSYREIFLNNKVHGKKLDRLTEGILHVIGVAAWGDRVDIIDSIAELQRKFTKV